MPVNPCTGGRCGYLGNPVHLEKCVTLNVAQWMQGDRKLGLLPLGSSAPYASVLRLTSCSCQKKQHEVPQELENGSLWSRPTRPSALQPPLNAQLVPLGPEVVGHKSSQRLEVEAPMGLASRAALSVPCECPLTSHRVPGFLCCISAAQAVSGGLHTHV
ncbi:hypothetical protein P7K49_029723 [Saguinus oedipus]|uniref:Uncharacterized protein n=1 Tax=Saguinus oedipus TaxID=9490 RepID=A0ABQ9U808_SAGOE|nr:hypothetical protein P7K49_029723 [Saguinus oedipus]